MEEKLVREAQRNVKVTRDPADDAFSKWIRLRDMVCLRCLSSVKLNHKKMPVSHQASHFMGRRKENTRFDPENVCTLCSGCHLYFTAHPAEHYQWQVARLGETTVESLILRSNMYCKKDRTSEAIYWRQKLKETA